MMGSLLLFFLQPFLRGLVTADVELPSQLRHAGEMLVLVDQHLAVLEFRIAARHHIIAFPLEDIRRIADGGWLPTLGGWRVGLPRVGSSATSDSGRPRGCLAR